MATQDQTAEVFADPQVGDRFQEMFSYWVYVVAVEPGGRVATMGAGAPCTFPADAELRVFASHDEYRQHYRYQYTPGYWVRTAGRDHDVEGWFPGWPEVTGPPDCRICRSLVAPGS